MNTNLKDKKAIIVSLLINGFIPLIAYRFFILYFSELNSLIIATTIPFIDNIYHIVKEKKIDAFAMFVLAGFILGIIAVLLGGGETFLLLRESFITGFLGLIFLISLLFPRPLIYYFVERFSGSDKIDKSILKEKWKIPYFRYGMRLMTFIWAIDLILEAIVKVILVYCLSVSQFLVISSFVSYGIMGLAIIWQIYYVKKFKSKLAKESL